MTRARISELPYRYEASAVVPATPVELFRHADDPARLATHMDESSWMLFGGRFATETDAAGGRALGSRIRMHGRVLGVSLGLEESITERDPPHRKAWETLGEPRLLVIGRYRMGFDVDLDARGSTFRVFIDYALPVSMSGRWLGRLFGRRYARWCTQRMLQDVVRRFASPEAAHRHRADEIPRARR